MFSVHDYKQRWCVKCLILQAIAKYHNFMGRDNAMMHDARSSIVDSHPCTHEQYMCMQCYIQSVALRSKSLAGFTKLNHGVDGKR